MAKANHYYGLILAGGRGTRFWPRSRKKSAKQVLSFGGERTLIQQTVDRLRTLLPPERIWVITNGLLRNEIIKQLPNVPPHQIVAEPLAAKHHTGNRSGCPDSAQDRPESGDGRIPVRPYYR